MRIGRDDLGSIPALYLYLLLSPTPKYNYIREDKVRNSNQLEEEAYSLKR